MPYHWSSTDKTEDIEADDVIIDDINFFNESDLDNNNLLSVTNQEAHNEALKHLVQRFCICIGDLSRYFVDYFSGKAARQNDYYFKMSEFYYKAAWTIEPSNGVPFNQLGTLYLDDTLFAIYYFFRS